MKSTYLIIGFISIIVVGAVLFGFFVTGSPFETRARKFDQTRVSDISSVKNKIESYYRTNKKLPEKLSDLTLSSYEKDNIRDPETNQEYEYSTISSTSYKICAIFSTASDKNKDPYSYYGDSYVHPKGNYCFDLKIPASTIKAANKSNTATTLQKTTTFKDKNISSAETSALNIQTFTSVNFPYGFFSENTNEWGLINYENKSVSVTITFKEPVKIKSISNTFTHCVTKNCYTWSVTGTTKDKEVVDLLTEVKGNSDLESKQKVDSNKQISEVKITVIRKGGTDSYVHWKKIKFEYK